MSFQRITTIGSMPPANSEATPSRCRRSPSFSRRWISTRCGAQLGARAQAAQRLRDLLAGADEHLGELDGLLHRRLDAVEAELRGGLLGVVDDVVERGRERVAVAGVERARAPPAAGEPVDDVVGDAVAFLLADLQVLREGRVLGVVDEQVAQQQAAALHVAPGLLDQLHQRRCRGSGAGSSSGEHIVPATRRAAVPSRIFHASITTLQPPTARRLRGCAVVAAVPESTPSILYAGELEIRSGEGLVLATGRALTLSVREFELLAAMARRLGAIITREELYHTVWGGELRPGDRSVDVYVSKLRGKLEAALPDRRFIHTHPGFGYRFQPEPSRKAGASVADGPAGSICGAEPDSGRLSQDVHIVAPDR